MRLIDADALDYDFNVRCSKKDADNIANILYHMINDAPTIDAEPVRHGAWQECGGGWNGYACSQCGSTLPYSLNIDYTTAYCPHCGAKMDGGNDA